MKTRIKALILFAVILSSCTAGWHVNKALKKDPSLKNEFIDSVMVKYTYVDTIHTSDSTYIVNVREVDSVIQFVYHKYDFSDLKTRFQIRQENKTERKKIANNRKLEQTKVKQENKTIRHKQRQDRKVKNKSSLWWLWLGIGATISLIMRVLWNYLKTYIRLNK